MPLPKVVAASVSRKEQELATGVANSRQLAPSHRPTPPFHINSSQRHKDAAEYGPALRRNFATEVMNSVRISQFGWIRKWALEIHMERLKHEADQKGFVEVIKHSRLTLTHILICICFGAKISEEWIQGIESIRVDVMLMKNPKLPDFFPALTPLF
ncbi:hypothetical protein Ancab_022696 [Ancistrocladus abbreviatus]